MSDSLSSTHIEAALSGCAAPGPLLRISAGTRVRLAGRRRAAARRHKVNVRYESDRGSRTLQRSEKI